MKKFIKVYINSEMEKDFKDCCDLVEHEGKDKDCSTCSCNGGEGIGCLMECDEYKEVDPCDIRYIALHHGYDKQSRQCIEECSELIQAINKFWRKFLLCGERTSFDFNDMVNSMEYDNLVEEIADVEIMLAQLKILLKCGNEVVKVSDEKLSRQLGRMKE